MADLSPKVSNAWMINLKPFNLIIQLFEFDIKACIELEVLSNNLMII